MPFGGRAWTQHDLDRLVQMRDFEHKKWPVIARALFRSVGAVCIAYSNLKSGRRSPNATPRTRTSSGHGHVVWAKLTEQQIAERERLREARYARDLTSTFFGDPPRGYSALDEKLNAPFHGTDARAQDHQRGSPKSS